MRRNKRKFAVTGFVFSSALVLGAASAWPQTSGSTSGVGGAAGSDKSSMSGQMSQDQIKKIQQALKDKGHDPGPIDGNMNARTQQALRAFQKSQNLTVTGTLDSSTASALGVAPSSAVGSGSSSSNGTGSSRSGSGTGSSSDATGDNSGSSTKGSSGIGGSSGSGSRSSGGSSGSGAK